MSSRCHEPPFDIHLGVVINRSTFRASTSSSFEGVNTRMPNGVKMTPLDRLLVHIFSLACFQRKSSRDFSSFVGPNTLLEWREFLSALKTIF